VKKSFFAILIFILLCLTYNHTIFANTPVDSELTKEDYYKLLYENTKDSNEMILNTVYWSIGSLFTILLVLVGGNVIVNYRLNEKKVEAIRREVINEINNLKIESSKTASEFMTVSLENIKARLDADVRDINKTITEQTQSLYQATIKNIESVSKNMDATLKENEVKVEKTLTQLKRMIDENSARDHKKENESRLRLLEIQGEIDLLQGHPTNALNKFLEHAKLSLELGRSLDYPVKTLLDTIEKCTWIWPTFLPNLIKFCDMLPSEYALQVEKIKENVKKLPPP